METIKSETDRAEFIARRGKEMAGAALLKAVQKRCQALKEEEAVEVTWKDAEAEAYKKSFISQAMAATQRVPSPPPSSPKSPRLPRRSAPGVAGVIDLTEDDEEEKTPKKRKAEHKAEEKKKKLKINAKKICITIARCQEDLQAIADAFEDKWGICQYRLVKELHKDGFPHVHAGLKFKERKYIEGNELVVNGTRYVMNFQLVSKQKGGWKGWLKYMDKAPIETLCTLKESNFMGAENKEELFSLLKDERGELGAMMCWERIYKCWEEFNKKLYTWTPVFPLDSYKIPFYLKTVEIELTGFNTRRQVILLIGATRLGKTNMMRTLFHQSGHGYCRARHNFQEWLTTSGPMILDDLDDGQAGSTTKAPMKAWTDSQPFNMSGKYKRTTEMAPRQVFILTNEDPNWIHEAYWKRNAHIIRIDTLCYRKV